MSTENSMRLNWTADLGSQIKQARKRNKYPQQKLADALGVCSETLRLYEAGKIPLPLEALRIIVYELKATFKLGEITIAPSSFSPPTAEPAAEQTAFEFHNEYRYVGVTVRMSVSKEGFDMTGRVPPKIVNG